MGGHKRTVRSLEPEAMSGVVGEKATEYTAAWMGPAEVGGQR